MTAPQATATWLGTATVLLRLGELTVLTDPALDPVGAEHEFRVPGTDLTIPLQRTSVPVLPRDGLPPIDAVLLSHDEHADNFDLAGRAVARTADRLLTTESGALRLAGRAHGLPPWESVVLRRGATRARVTATPARHGPEGSEALVGDVTGFVIEVDGLPRALYVSGDTVLYEDLTQIGERFHIGPALLHLGRARFAPTGLTQYSMSGEQGVALAARLGATALVPVHHDGWAHFSEAPAELATELSTSPVPVLWPRRSEPVDLQPAMARP